MKLKHINISYELLISFYMKFSYTSFSFLFVVFAWSQLKISIVFVVVLPNNCLDATCINLISLIDIRSSFNQTMLQVIFSKRNPTEHCKANNRTSLSQLQYCMTKQSVRDLSQQKLANENYNKVKPPRRWDMMEATNLEPNKRTV